MQNMLGEEVERRVLTFEWKTPHLDVFVNGKWAGHVNPNGWQGYSMNLNYPLGEPILTNWHGELLSFAEMNSIMTEYKKHITDTQAMKLVYWAIANDRKISFDQAVDYVTEQKIPYIA